MEERHKQIADMIRENGKITIMEITEKYEISDESARRDLRILERDGMCKRTRGGAIAVQQVGLRPPADRNFEQMPVFDNYREIARKAAEMIRPNDVIYLTGGSFGYIMLSFLPREFRYTIVVNNVDVAKALRAFENAEVYLAGGKMRQSGSLVDSMATEFVRKMHFDRCFITGAGLTAAFGLSNGTDETATFQRAVIQNSRERVLLMPSGKIGINSFIKVCETDCFQKVITDWDCLDEQVSQLQDGGIEVIVVENNAET